MVIFNFNGKAFDNIEEMSRAMFNEAATNPDCTNLVWEYGNISNLTIVGGRIIYPDGTHGKGKCAYKGRIYEGTIEYKDNKLYVGGEFVKDV